MKINIIILVATLLFLNSCCLGIRDGKLFFYQNVKIKEKFISPPIDGSAFLVIDDTKQLDDLIKTDSLTKSRVLYVLWSLDSIVPITDYINEFPNLKEIEFYNNCSGIFVTNEIKNIKSIIIYDHGPKMLNLSKLASVEIIKYSCSYKDSKYFDDLVNFNNLKHLVLYLHYKTKTLDKRITNLNKLEKLDLLETELKTIPRSIRKMTSLRELTIDSEYEIKIPKFIFKMKSLRVLNIIGNDRFVQNFNREYKTKYPDLKIIALDRNNYFKMIEYYSVPGK
jgi:Leucine-rich repeat (LRR) protein